MIQLFCMKMSMLVFIILFYIYYIKILFIVYNAFKDKTKRRSRRKGGSSNSSSSSSNRRCKPKSILKEYELSYTEIPIKVRPRKNLVVVQ